jgi:NAD(P)H-quinone oxidoreductase subunit H
MPKIETRTDPMVINMDSHYSFMHGVLRLVVTLDGEDVVDCEPIIGYLHRGMEKIAENRTTICLSPTLVVGTMWRECSMKSPPLMQQKN